MDKDDKKVFEPDDFELDSETDDIYETLFGENHGQTDLNTDYVDIIAGEDDEDYIERDFDPEEEPEEQIDEEELLYDEDEDFEIFENEEEIDEDAERKKALIEKGRQKQKERIKKSQKEYEERLRQKQMNNISFERDYEYDEPVSENNYIDDDINYTNNDNYSASMTDVEKAMVQLETGVDYGIRSDNIRTSYLTDKEIDRMEEIQVAEYNARVVRENSEAFLMAYMANKFADNPEMLNDINMNKGSLVNEYSGAGELNGIVDELYHKHNIYIRDDNSYTQNNNIQDNNLNVRDDRNINTQDNNIQNNNLDVRDNNYDNRNIDIQNNNIHDNNTYTRDNIHDNNSDIRDDRSNTRSNYTDTQSNNIQDNIRSHNTEQNKEDQFVIDYINNKQKSHTSENVILVDDDNKNIKSDNNHKDIRNNYNENKTFNNEKDKNINTDNKQKTYTGKNISSVDNKDTRIDNNNTRNNNDNRDVRSYNNEKRIINEKGKNINNTDDDFHSAYYRNKFKGYDFKKDIINKNSNVSNTVNLSNIIKNEIYKGYKNADNFKNSEYIRELSNHNQAAGISEVNRYNVERDRYNTERNKERQREKIKNTKFNSQRGVSNSSASYKDKVNNFKGRINTSRAVVGGMMIGKGIKNYVNAKYETLNQSQKIKQEELAKQNIKSANDYIQKSEERREKWDNVKYKFNSRRQAQRDGFNKNLYLKKGYKSKSDFTKEFFNYSNKTHKIIAETDRVRKNDKRFIKHPKFKNFTNKAYALGKHTILGSITGYKKLKRVTSKLINDPALVSATANTVDDVKHKMNKGIEKNIAVNSLLIAGKDIYALGLNKMVYRVKYGKPMNVRKQYRKATGEKGFSKKNLNVFKNIRERRAFLKEAGFTLSLKGISQINDQYRIGMGKLAELNNQIKFINKEILKVSALIKKDRNNNELKAKLKSLKEQLATLIKEREGLLYKLNILSRYSKESFNIKGKSIPKIKRGGLFTTIVKSPFKASYRAIRHNLIYESGDEMRMVGTYLKSYKGGVRTVETVVNTSAMIVRAPAVFVRNRVVDVNNMIVKKQAKKKPSVVKKKKAKKKHTFKKKQKSKYSFSLRNQTRQLRNKISKFLLKNPVKTGLAVGVLFLLLMFANIVSEMGYARMLTSMSDNEFIKNSYITMDEKHKKWVEDDFKPKIPEWEEKYQKINLYYNEGQSKLFEDSQQSEYTIKETKIDEKEASQIVYNNSRDIVATMIEWTDNDMTGADGTNARKLKKYRDGVNVYMNQLFYASHKIKEFESPDYARKYKIQDLSLANIGDGRLDSKDEDNDKYKNIDIYAKETDIVKGTKKTYKDMFGNKYDPETGKLNDKYRAESEVKGELNKPFIDRFDMKYTAVSDKSNYYYPGYWSHTFDNVKYKEYVVWKKSYDSKIKERNKLMKDLNSLIKQNNSLVKNINNYKSEGRKNKRNYLKTAANAGVGGLKYSDEITGSLHDNIIEIIQNKRNDELIDNYNRYCESYDFSASFCTLKVGEDGDYFNDRITRVNQKYDDIINQLNNYYLNIQTYDKLVDDYTKDKQNIKNKINSKRADIRNKDIEIGELFTKSLIFNDNDKFEGYKNTIESYLSNFEGYTDLKALNSYGKSMVDTITSYIDDIKPDKKIELKVKFKGKDPIKKGGLAKTDYDRHINPDYISDYFDYSDEDKERYGGNLLDKDNTQDSKIVNGKEVETRRTGSTPNADTLIFRFDDIANSFITDIYGPKNFKDVNVYVSLYRVADESIFKNDPENNKAKAGGAIAGVVFNDIHDPVGADQKVVKGYSTFNRKIKYDLKPRSPIYAAADGVIEKPNNFSLSDNEKNSLIINAGGDRLFLYDQVQNPVVKEGDIVKKGQKIAESKDEFYFSIMAKGVVIDPSPYIENSEVKEEKKTIELTEEEKKEVAKYKEFEEEFDKKTKELNFKPGQNFKGWNDDKIFNAKLQYTGSWNDKFFDIKDGDKPTKIRVQRDEEGKNVKQYTFPRYDLRNIEMEDLERQGNTLREMADGLLNAAELETNNTRRRKIVRRAIDSVGEIPYYPDYKYLTTDITSARFYGNVKNINGYTERGLNHIGFINWIYAGEFSDVRGNWTSVDKILSSLDKRDDNNPVPADIGYNSHDDSFGIYIGGGDWIYMDIREGGVVRGKKKFNQIYKHEQLNDGISFVSDNDTPQAKVYTLLIKKGFTPASASGITATIGEVSNYNPKAVGVNNRYGLMQWDKDEFDQYVNKNKDSLETQIDYLFDDIQRNRDRFDNGDTDILIKSNNAPDSAELYYKNFSRIPRKDMKISEVREKATNIFNDISRGRLEAED